MRHTSDGLMRRLCRTVGLGRNLHGRSRASRAPAIRLGLARIEDRVTPAVHDVTQGTSFATIQAAVNAANPGDTLLADPGVYAESVTVNKSLIIEGAQHGVDARNGRPGASESILDA